MLSSTYVIGLTMKTKIQFLPVAEESLAQFSRTKTDTAVDNTILAEFALGTLAGVMSFRPRF
jgi:hypothetical protein